MQPEPSSPEDELTPAEAYAFRNRHPELFGELQDMAHARASRDELIMHAINRGLTGQEALGLLSQVAGRPIELAPAAPPKPVEISPEEAAERAKTGYVVGTRSPAGPRREPTINVGGGSRMHGLIAMVFGALLAVMGGGFSLVTHGAYDDGGRFVVFPYLVGFGVLSMAAGLAMLLKK